MEINIYTVSQLPEYTGSEQFARSRDLPVSPQRADSYVHNPRMHPDDPVLFVMTDLEGELVAYRTVLPDDVHGHHLAWLSGNWVRPDCRRKGYSTELFHRVYQAWKGKLISTGTSPESRAVYDKTGKFFLYKGMKGVRAYFRSDLHGLLPARHMIWKRLKWLLFSADAVINLLHDVYVYFVKHSGRKVAGYHTITNGTDHEIEKLIASKNRNELSNRNAREIEWIIRYPWILQMKNKDPVSRKYNFSSSAGLFRNLSIKLYDSRDSFCGWMLLTIIGKKMTMPYFFGEEPAVSLAINVIHEQMIKWKLNYFTCFHPLVSEAFFKSPVHVLYRKKMIREYYVTRQLAGELPDPGNILIQDGEGDMAFV